VSIKKKRRKEKFVTATLLSKYCASRIKYMLIEFRKKEKNIPKAQMMTYHHLGLFLCSSLLGVTAAAAAGSGDDMVFVLVAPRHHHWWWWW
jgi:hypothetical protein